MAIIIDTGSHADELSDADEYLIVEALHALRKTKVEALELVSANYPRAPGDTRQFTPKEFGIPQIDRLLELLGEEP